ncbi:uncharacterized protein LOC133297129 [Gastrolobium bilobum]|uniref:uncharacterized protein LOC133297129 n=1 Tax=Gastrolobium bilobum TaxID=150636 RepID=UPI002AB12E9C|nr:uncharacterized protein LOC133297129 [Gastrolobium bilobum]
MLGILCATRPKPWIFSFLHGSPAHHAARLAHGFASDLSPSFSHFGPDSFTRGRIHSSACKLRGGGGSGAAAASIWHAILPCGGDGLQRGGGVVTVHHDHELKGEGSWNVAWDARPARWLHRPDSAWLLFGVCACLSPPVCAEADPEAVPAAPPAVPEENSDGRELMVVDDEVSSDYRVTGVPADGRCLFRAIAHGACLRNGEEAPDENRQRELADELRARVVDELLKRRDETEWYIEGDFDAYVKRIQEPYVWGGEPELLMASHVLKTPISVFMRDTNSVDLLNIAKYGEEYRKDKDISIDVLFHGYGHYDILETL